MTLRVIEPAHANGRYVVQSGMVDIGALFPPVGRETKWSWRMWVGAHFPVGGSAADQDEALEQIETRWRSFLAEAGLNDAGTESYHRQIIDAQKSWLNAARLWITAEWEARGEADSEYPEERRCATILGKMP